MHIDKLIDDSQAQIADMCSSPEMARWVIAKAEIVDLERDMCKAILCSDLLKSFVTKYGWAAAANNNVYWNRTKSPMSILVTMHPQGNDLITLINPHIVYSQTQHLDDVEACGSLGELNFIVYRPSKVVVEGYVLEQGCQASLEFSSHKSVRRVLHELDHLNGIIIAEKGEFCGFYDKGLKSIKDYNSYLMNWRYFKEYAPFDTLDNSMHLVLEHDKLGSHWQVYRTEVPKTMSYGKPLILELPDCSYSWNFLEKFPLGVFSNLAALNLPVHGIYQQ